MTIYPSIPLLIFYLLKISLDHYFQHAVFLKLREFRKYIALHISIQFTNRPRLSQPDMRPQSVALLLIRIINAPDFFPCQQVSPHLPNFYQAGKIQIITVKETALGK